MNRQHCTKNYIGLNINYQPKVHVNNEICENNGRSNQTWRRKCDATRESATDSLCNGRSVEIESETCKEFVTPPNRFATESSSHNYYYYYDLEDRKCDAADFEIISENIHGEEASGFETSGCRSASAIKCNNNQSDIESDDVSDDVSASEDGKCDTTDDSKKTESVSEEQDLQTADDTQNLKFSTLSETDADYESDWESDISNKDKDKGNEQQRPFRPKKLTPRFPQFTNNSSSSDEIQEYPKRKKKNSLEDIVGYFKNHGLDIRDVAKHDQKLSKLLETRLPELNLRQVNHNKNGKRHPTIPSWYIRLQDDEVRIFRQLRAYLDPLCPVSGNRTVDPYKIATLLNKVDLGPVPIDVDDVTAAIWQCSKGRGRVDFDEFLLTLASEYTNSSCCSESDDSSQEAIPLRHSPTRRQQVLYSAIAKINGWDELKDKFRQQLFLSKPLKNVVSPREKTTGLYEIQLQNLHCKLRKAPFCSASANYCPYGKPMVPILTETNCTIPWDMKLKIRDMKYRKMKILEQLPEAELIPELRAMKECSSLVGRDAASSASWRQQRAVSYRTEILPRYSVTVTKRTMTSPLTETVRKNLKQTRQVEANSDAGFATNLWRHLQIERVASKQLRCKYKKSDGATQLAESNLARLRKLV